MYVNLCKYLICDTPPKSLGPQVEKQHTLLLPQKNLNGRRCRILNIANFVSSHLTKFVLQNSNFEKLLTKKANDLIWLLK